MGYGSGADRLLLWLPVIVTHRITKDSPLASWANMSGFLADADSCIAMTARRLLCHDTLRLHGSPSSSAWALGLEHKLEITAVLRASGRFRAGSHSSYILHRPAPPQDGLNLSTVWLQTSLDLATQAEDCS